MEKQFLVRLLSSQDDVNNHPKTGLVAGPEAVYLLQVLGVLKL